jgi:hypothetical protein
MLETGFDYSSLISQAVTNKTTLSILSSLFVCVAVGLLLADAEKM